MFDESVGNFEGALFEYIVGKTNLSFSVDQFSTSARHTPEEMASSPVALSLLRFLVCFAKPALVVEIGTFIGFTTANLAACLGPGGKIITFEKFDEFAKIAEKNLKALNVENKVEIKHLISLSDPSLSLYNEATDAQTVTLFWTLILPQHKLKKVISSGVLKEALGVTILQGYQGY